jgi:hypothetical protein
VIRSGCGPGPRHGATAGRINGRIVDPAEGISAHRYFGLRAEEDQQCCLPLTIFLHDLRHLLLKIGQCLVLFLHFPQQDGRELIVANTFYLTGIIADHQIGVNLVHLFGDEAVLLDSFRLSLQVKGHRAQLLKFLRF